jgi:hypothetical protein
MLPPSYVTEYADHRRASRVDVMPRPLTHLERLVPADLHKIPPSPEFVLVADGPRWAVCNLDGVLVIDATGTRVLRPRSGHWIAALEDGEVRYGNRLYRGDERLRRLGPLGLFDETCLQVCARWQGGIWTAIVQTREPFAADELRVQVAGNGPRENDPSAPSWATSFPGEGTAAIADDGTVVVALLDRTVHLLAHPRDPEREEPDVCWTLELPHEPYAISATAAGFVVVSAIESTAASTSTRLGRLHGRGARAFTADWRTEIRCLTATGATAWVVELDMPVLQPAIEGGDQRVIVAGHGLACIGAGRVAWMTPTVDDVYATAYADGTIAAGVGSRIVILGRDGAPMQTLQLPEHARVVTPPAIGPGGTLAIGTSEHVYVAP